MRGRPFHGPQISVLWLEADGEGAIWVTVCLEPAGGLPNMRRLPNVRGLLAMRMEGCQHRSDPPDQETWWWRRGRVKGDNGSCTLRPGFSCLQLGEFPPHPPQWGCVPWEPWSGRLELAGPPVEEGVFWKRAFTARVGCAGWGGTLATEVLLGLFHPYHLSPRTFLLQPPRLDIKSPAFLLFVALIWSVPGGGVACCHERVALDLLRD